MTDPNIKRIRVMSLLLNNYQQKIANLKNDNEELACEIKGLSSDIMELRVRNIKMWSEKGYKTEIINTNITLTKENKMLIKRVKKLEKKVISLESDIKFLKVDNENLKAENVTLKAENVMLKERIIVLEERIVVLEEKVDVLMKENRIFKNNMLLNKFTDIFRYFRDRILKKLCKLSAKEIYLALNIANRSTNEKLELIANAVETLNLTMDDMKSFVIINNKRIALIHFIQCELYYDTNYIQTQIIEFKNELISDTTRGVLLDERIIHFIDVIISYTNNLIESGEVEEEE